MENITFTDILRESAINLSSSATITVAAILIALVSSLVCGLFIAYIYKKSFQGVLFQKSYAVTIVLVSLVTTTVIMVISGNLVLSLGMVGALSVIRFRAAIKDPLDIVYIFWAVAIGIANGVAYFSVSFISSIFIGSCLLLLQYLPSGKRMQLLVINCNHDSRAIVVDRLNKVGGKYKIKSQTENNNQCELVIELAHSNKFSELDDLNNISGVTQVRILDYSANN